MSDQDRPPDLPDRGRRPASSDTEAFERLAPDPADPPSEFEVRTSTASYAIGDPEGVTKLGEVRRIFRNFATAGNPRQGLDPRTVEQALELLAQFEGEVARLRQFPAIWAVRYGNYEPSEVIALYDNEQAARDHAELSDDPLEVIEMEVRRTPPQRST